jgi:hypothetical protein
MTNRDALAQELDLMRADGNVRRAYTDDLFARIWMAARAEVMVDGTHHEVIYVSDDARTKALEKALRDLLAEWDKFSRYGSSIAKAANEAVSKARALMEPQA